jgi:hypothetical protein
LLYRSPTASLPIRRTSFGGIAISWKFFFLQKEFRAISHGLRDAGFQKSKGLDRIEGPSLFSNL